MIKFEINQRAGKKVDQKWAGKIIKSVLGTVGVGEAEISIAVVGDREMQRLNKQYRGKNRVTDVLSFTYQTQNTRYKIPLAGEIIICYPQAVRQARQNFAPQNLGGRAKKRERVMEETKLLLVHGLLHLCGYEHERSVRAAREMENLQSKIIKLLS